MAHSDYSYQTTQKSLLATMLLSLVLHAVGVAYLRPFAFDADKVTPPLVVELQRPEPPPPPPPPEPEPEPPKPEPPKPQPKPLPPPPIKTPLPPPVERAVIPDALPPPPPPQVIAAAPEKVAEPTFVAPPSEPTPVKREPEPVVEEAIDWAKYGGVLADEFKKHQKFPRIAQQRGWQGTVRVKLEVENGVMVSSAISESSGYEVLEALEATKQATLFPPLPDNLKNRKFTITVPVVYRFKSD